ncbi:hypothetical protein Pyn_30329 [Prunus yedoensis var. nudiflora]|uniref:F-box domain-containing protein n=1 Tax=Prunus yedoensis var. nudiflora TaxID=2094558 RepID=A0A314YEM4_PRUYE|nr:hypothetical protein Pyn_30329 [Prunus yedoensis var. nudiflora]
MPMNIRLDDLPEFVLLKILSRLPPKCAARCMFVSKRWFSLIFDPYFFRHYFQVQSDTQNPIIARARARAIIISDRRRTTRGRSKFLSTSSSEQPDEDEPCERKFFSMSSEPDHQPHEHELSLSFLPCFQADIVDPYKGEPVVVGAYNDLILCCATTYYQRDYYICNPYTKQWDALPPPPRRGRQGGLGGRHKCVMVGFICDPYYRKQAAAGQERSSRRSVNIQLNHNLINVEYRYKVVRINDDKLEFPEVSGEFYLEIFSSETGKWTQGRVNSLRRFSFSKLAPYPGVAHNGSLYWWSDVEGFTVGLDLYSPRDQLGDSIYLFRYIDKPEIESGRFDFLSECGGGGGGCLRMCVFSSTNLDHDDPPHTLGAVSVWELKDDGHGVWDWDWEGHGQVKETAKWCLVDTAFMFDLISANPLIKNWNDEHHRRTKRVLVLAFDPNNEDVLYLQLFGRIVMYNIGARTLKETTWTTQFTPFTLRWGGRSVFPVFPFVLPWWPTPILTSRSNHHHEAEEQHIHIHVH